MPNLQYCLRPHLTEAIYELLAEGKNINVHGEEGQGLNRLVEDLQKIAPDDVHFVQLSMRSFADSYSGFMLALQSALSIKSNENFAAAIHNFIADSPKKLWLVIEHFDRLTEKPASEEKVDRIGYNRLFLDQLNSFRNNSKVSLLFTSAHKINTQELYIGGEHIRGSQLELSKHLDLTPMTFDLLGEEFSRLVKNRIDASTFLDAPEWAILVAEIAAHKKPYDFLQFIGPRIEPSEKTTNANFNALLNYWKKEFNQLNSRSIANRLNLFEKALKKIADHTTRITALAKVAKIIKTKWGFIVSSIFALILWLWQYGEKIWAWVSSFIAE